MTTTQYQNFITVAECGSITGAARELNVAQPALTSQIKRLEEIVGAPLFIRYPRSVELTEAGKIFYQSAKSILLIEENSSIGIKNLTAGGGTLSIGITRFLPDPAFQAAMERYYNSFPGVAVSLYEENTSSLISKLEAGVIEVAILVSSKPLPPSFESLSASNNKLYVCREADCPYLTHIKPGQQVRLADLDGVPLSAPRALYRYLEEACHQEGIHPVWKAISDSRHATLSLAQARNMVAVLALRRQILENMDLVCNRLSDQVIGSRRSLVKFRGRQLSTAAKNFLDVLDFEALGV